jgi:hypothetical protein
MANRFCFFCLLLLKRNYETCGLEPGEKKRWDFVDVYPVERRERTMGREILFLFFYI